MMRPKFLVVTTSGLSNPVPLDRYVNGYAVGVVVTSAMRVNYTVQFSMSDPYANYTNSYNVSGNWQNMGDPVMVNQSATRTSNFAFPPLAVRVLSTTFSAGTGASPASLTLTINPMGAGQ